MVIGATLTGGRVWSQRAGGGQNTGRIFAAARQCSRRTAAMASSVSADGRRHSRRNRSDVPIRGLLELVLLLTQWSAPKALKFRQKVLPAGDDGF